MSAAVVAGGLVPDDPAGVGAVGAGLAGAGALDGGRFQAGQLGQGVQDLEDVAQLLDQRGRASGGQLFTQVGGADERRDDFGWSLAAGDFNNNGFDDLPPAPRSRRSAERFAPAR